MYSTLQTIKRKVVVNPADGWQQIVNPRMFNALQSHYADHVSWVVYPIPQDHVNA